MNKDKDKDKDISIAQIIFDGDFQKLVLEDALDETGMEFERMSFDDYDRSVEFYDVKNDHRLNEKASKIILDAGFNIAFLNHKDKWETHYNKGSEFKKGWRVSYPHKRGEEGGSILLEEDVEGWPKDWTKSGYVKVINKKKGK